MYRQCLLVLGKDYRTAIALLLNKVTNKYADDTALIFTEDVYEVRINENVPINSTVFSVGATDKEEGA